jgi:hypothetical protein
MTPTSVPTPPPQPPWSCDTFVALPDMTADGSMLLAKNSDRPAEECQPLRYWPRRQSSATSALRLAYLEIPDVEQSWAHLGASPYWCWGHELGLNEWGVGIGNEALFTRDLAEHVTQSRHGQPPPAGILGMELVRLGLERATTAQQAVSTITELVAAHGQWGSGVPGRPIEQGAYDNSYLVADPRGHERRHAATFAEPPASGRLRRADRERGVLADLEAKERERCASFATKAVAAGLAERTVRVAERQGQLMVEMVQAALREVDLSPEQASAFKAALARQARELTASPVG